MKTIHHLPARLRSRIYHFSAAAMLLASAHLPAATLLKYNFEGSNPWTGMSGYFQTAGGTLTATPSYTNAGTIDAYGTNTNSNGIKLSVNSASSTGNWSAGINSGLLTLLTSNSTTNLGLLTLSFSLSASTAHPVTVKIESYNSSNARTGGLKTLIFPAAPDFYQRYALDLSTMSPDGAGAFNPVDPKVKIYFEIDNTSGGEGWPRAAGEEVRIDNINYATPKYYVRPNAPGSNSNDGLTSSTPFATPSKAAGLVQPGDIVALMDGGGAVYSGGVTLSTPGTPEAWIVLKNYPGQKPVIQSGWNVISITKGAQGAPYTGTAVPAYIEVRGLTLRGYSGIDANGDRMIDPAYQDTVGQVQSASNTNGFTVDGRNCTYVPHHFRVADSITEFCPGGGMVSYRADRISYENNINRNNVWWTMYAASGMSSLNATDSETSTGYRFLFQGNICYSNETMIPWYGSSGQDYSDGNGIIIDTHVNYTGRTLIQNNLVYNNGGSGIHVYHANSTDIVHNTAYLNSASPRLQYGQIFANTAFDVRMLNNILVAPVNTTGDSSFNESVTSNNNNTSGTIYYQNNIYFGGNSTPISGGNFSPNIVGDPLFLSPSIDPSTNDFHLRAASPARGYGQIVSYRANRDLDNTLRLINGATDSGTYQIQANETYAPVFSPQPGNFTTAQSISLASDTAGAKIVYTTNGTTPTVDGSGAVTNGSTYSAAIPVSAAATLKAIAWKSGQATSYVSTAKYTFNTTLIPVATPTFDIAPGTYDATQRVHILVRTPGAIVRYTNDGSDPTPTSGTLADEHQIVINASANLRVIAYRPGRANSAILAGQYFIRYAYETENLTVVDSSGDTHRIVSDTRYSNAQGTILDATAAGDYVVYKVTGLPAGNYDLRVGVKNYNSRGTWQLSMAPYGSSSFINHGPAVDQYTSAEVFTEIDLGTVNVGSTGDKSVKFTVTGKNAASSGYSIALDYIKFIPQ